MNFTIWRAFSFWNNCDHFNWNIS